MLDILADGYGFLRTQGYLPSETDAYVGLSTIRRNGLRKGDYVSGQTRPARENEKYAAIQKVLSVNGVPIEQCGNLSLIHISLVHPAGPACHTGERSCFYRVLD